MILRPGDKAGIIPAVRNVGDAVPQGAASLPGSCRIASWDLRQRERQGPHWPPRAHSLAHTGGLYPISHRHRDARLEYKYHEVYRGGGVRTPWPCDEISGGGAKQRGNWRAQSTRRKTASVQRQDARPGNAAAWKETCAKCMDGEIEPRQKGEGDGK